MNNTTKATISALLITNNTRSILKSSNSYPLAYMPFGYCHALPSHGLSPAFNGETFELPTCHYQLGNGYRIYNTVICRFHIPDSWSPFGAGGLNTYVYCGGDPINNTDSSGHGRVSINHPKAVLTKIAGGIPTHLSRQIGMPHLNRAAPRNPAAAKRQQKYIDTRTNRNNSSAEAVSTYYTANPQPRFDTIEGLNLSVLDSSNLNDMETLTSNAKRIFSYYGRGKGMQPTDTAYGYITDSNRIQLTSAQFDITIRHYEFKLSQQGLNSNKSSNFKDKLYQALVNKQAYLIKQTVTPPTWADITVFDPMELIKGVTGIRKP